MSGRGWERKVQGRSPICTASALMTLLKHNNLLHLSPSLQHPHAHTQNTDTLSTRKETEIGNKDHPLCLRTVNGSSNVFNLSPESNNRAHSTPAQTVVLFTYKLLDSILPAFHNSSLFLIPLHSAHERIHLRDKATWEMCGASNSGPSCLSGIPSKLLHSFTLCQNSISKQGHVSRRPAYLNMTGSGFNLPLQVEKQCHYFGCEMQSPLLSQPPSLYKYLFKYC